jgi:membrane dipeptidase
MKYNYIDMHCDTLLKEIEDGRLYNNSANMLDIHRMALAGQGAQFFAVFFPPKTPEGVQLPDDALFAKARQLLLDTAAAHPDVLRMAYTASDIERSVEAGCCAAVLTIEDARAVDGDLLNLRRFYDAGVRAMSLTWNFKNCFGYPNSPDPEIMCRGLADFGREAIPEMNRLGILIDVSHLSDGGFADVATLTSKPFAATHSNCRALCDHPRNMTDAMIRTLADKGGVAGINFAPDFLSPDSNGESRIRDLCRHVLHFIDVGGEECVGLGTDFDGIHGQFEVGQPTDMEKLFDALLQNGMSERQLEKFAFLNVLRILLDVL